MSELMVNQLLYIFVVGHCLTAKRRIETVSNAVREVTKGKKNIYKSPKMKLPKQKQPMNNWQGSWGVC